jgi:general secretion pathway protein K
MTRRTHKCNCAPGRRRGGALLTVLWLTAALSTIAFSVAHTVRAETERVSTLADGIRAYYLAAGAVERAILYVHWGPAYRLPDGSPRFYGPGTPFLRMNFPTGEAMVEVIPESSKMSLNGAREDELIRLVSATGIDPERARTIARAVIDWRTPMPPNVYSPFDQFYLSSTPSFRARHASFEEIEELLLVQGMTPELFYGTWQRDPLGRLVPVGGLKDCLSPYGTQGQYDVNTVSPLVLLSLGMSPEAVAMLIEARSRNPIRNVSELNAVGVAGPARSRLRIGGNAIFTLRATATLRLPDGRVSDVRRSVAATVKYNFNDPNATRHFEVLRWQDNAGYR